jgi:4-hydroxy-3-polyprenylbenzoate decarboxylase
VFHVTAVTRRKNPVYSATLVGRPPMEDCYLAKATERLFLPMLQSVMPEIKNYWFPWEGVFHNIVVVSSEKEYPGHAHKLMSGLWGQGQMSFCKAIVVVDEDVDPSDAGAVTEALVHRFDLEEDMVLAKGVLDVLDHSAPSANFGAKIGIDLTRRFPGETERPIFQISLKKPSDSEIETALNSGKINITGYRVLFPELCGKQAPRNRFLGLTAEKRPDLGGRKIAESLLANEGLDYFNIFILYDKDLDIRDDSLLLWKLFNNVDPSRDIARSNGRAVIDACKKGPMDGHWREWPEDLSFD